MAGTDRIVDKSLGFDPAEWEEECDGCGCKFYPHYESQHSTKWGQVQMLCDRCSDLHVMGVLWPKEE